MLIGHQGHPAMHVIGVLLIVALVVAVLYVVWRWSRPAGALHLAPAGHDAALATLRMRYARGEVARDEFIQASVDLGDSVAIASLPTQAPAAPPVDDAPAG